MSIRRLRSIYRVRTTESAVSFTYPVSISSYCHSQSRYFRLRSIFFCFIRCADFHTHTTTFYCLQSTQIHAKCTLYGTRIFYYLAFALLPDFCRRREPSQVWNFGSFELIKNNLQLLVFSTWNSRALSCWICFHWITSGCTQKTFHINHIQRTLELEEQRKNMTMEHKLFCRGNIFISLRCNILLINEIKLDLLGDRHQLIPYPNKYPPDWLRCHQLWQLFSHSNQAKWILPF